jgi:4-hydroxybenzoate polyprenyltransferase
MTGTSRMARLAGLYRVVHPFPSALDAVAAAAIALIAGADVSVAARLGLGMLGLQFAIGSANDIADASRDRLNRPAKPIPAGFVGPRQAVGVFFVAASAGLACAASVGLTPLAVGIIGLADGLLYDLRLKSTIFSWLPFAAGVGLLPVYAWLGATGTIPVAFRAIVPMAVLAGAVLAVANALADMERDRQGGVVSIATILGRRRSIAANVVGVALLQIVVVVSSAYAGFAGATISAELAGATLGWVGLAMSASPIEHLSRLGWEVQAIGILAIGAGWLAALVGAGLL